MVRMFTRKYAGFVFSAILLCSLAVPAFAVVTLTAKTPFPATAIVGKAVTPAVYDMQVSAPDSVIFNAPQCKADPQCSDGMLPSENMHVSGTTGPLYPSNTYPVTITFTPTTADLQKSQPLKGGLAVYSTVYRGCYCLKNIDITVKPQGSSVVSVKVEHKFPVEIVAGDIASSTYEVQNLTTDTQKITHIEVSRTANAHLSVPASTDGCTNHTLAKQGDKDDHCTFVVKYAPTEPDTTAKGDYPSVTAVSGSTSKIAHSDDDYGILAIAPNLTLIANSHPAFPNAFVKVGDSEEASYTVSNQNTIRSIVGSIVPSVIGNPYITNKHMPTGTASSTDCGQYLQPKGSTGDTCQFTVVYHPTAPDSKSAKGADYPAAKIANTKYEFTPTASADKYDVQATNPEISITGNNQHGFVPQDIILGKSAQQTATASYVVTNLTDHDLVLKSLAKNLMGDNYKDTITLQTTETNPCQGNLAAKGTCHLDLLFNPITREYPKGVEITVNPWKQHHIATPQVVISHAAEQESDLTYSPSAANDCADCAVVASNRRWLDVVPEQTTRRVVSFENHSGVGQVTVKNAGTDVLSNITVPTWPSDLTLDQNNCPAQLDAQKTCSILYKYTPSGPVTKKTKKQETVTIQYTSPDNGTDTTSTDVTLEEVPLGMFYQMPFDANNIDHSKMLTGSVYQTSVSPNIQTIYAATSNGLAMSTDSGKTWQTMTEGDGLPSNNISRVAVTYSGNTPLEVFVVTSGGIAAVAPDLSAVRWTIPTLNSQTIKAMYPVLTGNVSQVYVMDASHEIYVLQDTGALILGWSEGATSVGTLQNFYINPQGGQMMAAFAYKNRHAYCLITHPTAKKGDSPCKNPGLLSVYKNGPSDLTAMYPVTSTSTDSAYLTSGSTLYDVPKFIGGGDELPPPDFWGHGTVNAVVPGLLIATSDGLYRLDLLDGHNLLPGHGAVRHITSTGGLQAFASTETGLFHGLFPNVNILFPAILPGNFVTQIFATHDAKGNPTDIFMSSAKYRALQAGSTLSPYYTFGLVTGSLGIDAGKLSSWNNWENMPAGSASNEVSALDVVYDATGAPTAVYVGLTTPDSAKPTPDTLLYKLNPDGTEAFVVDNLSKFSEKITAITALYLAEQGGEDYVYVGTTGGSVIRLINRKDKAEAVDQVDKHILSTTANVTSMSIGPSKDPTTNKVPLYIGTDGAVPIHPALVKTDLAFSPTPYQDFKPSVQAPINALYATDKKLYVGTKAGLYILDTKTGKPIAGTSVFLPGVHITGIYATIGTNANQAKELYVATIGQGVKKLDPATGKVLATYTGLPSNNIYSLFGTTPQDGSGNVVALFAGTDNGAGVSYLR